MKPQFTQKWQHSESLARHAWRCYLNRPDVTVGAMSKASYNSFVACNTVWNQLKPSEQEIIRAFHAIRIGGEESEMWGNSLVELLASERHIPANYIWAIIRKAWRMWAIERGLADE